MKELELLVQPLTGDGGHCGTDLIFSSEFDAIREARRYDDPSLSQGEWVTQIKEAEWDKAIRLCEDILAGQSKDLRVAAWLTEAYGQTAGLRGLGNGYRLLARLCEIFWDDIHPLTDDGELEQRTGPLDWLLGQTTQLIRQTPLTRSAKGSFSLIDQESARSMARNIERNPELAGDYARTGSVTLDIFEAALKDTPASSFRDEMKAADELKAAMGALQAVLESRLGEHAPTFAPAYEALDDVVRFCRRHGGGETETAASQAVMPESENMPNAVSGITPNLSPGGMPQSRAQAIRQLQEIADFFRRTEPHSPVAYLADKAARWGSMPLHEWLRTVVKDDAALSRMEELLGVERPAQDNSGY
ncbi:MAG: type VI secretion system protein TssA [Dechloromonas sp.]|nr:MAG: type VI secretion system protein TssA [Dechloromonas sp.]